MPASSRRFENKWNGRLVVRKQVKALTVLYLVPCQHFGVYFAPYQILLVLGTGIGGGIILNGKVLLGVANSLVRNGISVICNSTMLLLH